MCLSLVADCGCKASRAYPEESLFATAHHGHNCGTNRAAGPMAQACKACSHQASSQTKPKHDISFQATVSQSSQTKPSQVEATSSDPGHLHAVSGLCCFSKQQQDNLSQLMTTQAQASSRSQQELCTCFLFFGHPKSLLQAGAPCCRLCWLSRAGTGVTCLGCVFGRGFEGQT